MNTLCFDIETIPQPTTLTSIQEEELNRKLENYIFKNPSADLEETKRLIMGTSPFFGEIVCIGLGHDDGDFKTKALIGEEINILQDFWKILQKFNGAFVSYNGLEFDVPFIIARSMKHRIEVTNKSFIDTRRFQKYPHFDVKQIISDWDRYKSCKLQLACDLLNVDSPKEGEIKAKDVAQAYREGKIDKIVEYCLKDIVATYEIYNIVKQYTFIR